MGDGGVTDIIKSERVHFSVKAQETKRQGVAKIGALSDRGLSPTLRETLRPYSPQQEHGSGMKSLVVDMASLPTVANTMSQSYSGPTQHSSSLQPASELHHAASSQVHSELSGRLKLFLPKPPPMELTAVKAGKKKASTNDTNVRSIAKETEKEAPAAGAKARGKRISAAKKEKQAPTSAEPNDQLIEDCLKRSTRAGLHVEGFSLKQARAAVEQELKLNADFFKNNRIWKARSKEIVDQTVQEQAMPSARTKQIHKFDERQPADIGVDLDALRKGLSRASATAADAFKQIRESRSGKDSTSVTPPASIASLHSHSHAHPAHSPHTRTTPEPDATSSRDTTPSQNTRPIVYRQRESPDGLV